MGTLVNDLASSGNIAIVALLFMVLLLCAGIIGLWRHFVSRDKLWLEQWKVSNDNSSTVAAWMERHSDKQDIILAEMREARK